MKVELSTMDWRKYLKSNNPVAAALLSKMGYSKSERIQVKKELATEFIVEVTKLNKTRIEELRREQKGK